MQYTVLRTVQSALHFTSLTDLFTQTTSRLLWEAASSHMLQLMQGCSYTYPPLSIARYAFIQLSELEQCRVKKLAQGFNTAAQDSNPGPLSRESEALPLSHCALCSPRSLTLKVCAALWCPVWCLNPGEGAGEHLSWNVQYGLGHWPDCFSTDRSPSAVVHKYHLKHGHCLSTSWRSSVNGDIL